MLVKIKNKLYTESKDNLNWYGETIIKKGNVFLREWSPKNSKIAAAIRKGLKLDVKNKDILYLGCSTGTTVSHLSDLQAKTILGVDVSAFVMRDFLLLSKKRENIIPLMYDASKLKNIEELKNKKFDIVFEDIATKELVEIFIDNVKNFLKEKGVAWLTLKTRSIDSVKTPKEILQDAIKKIEKSGLKIEKIFNLEPFEKHHYFLVVRKN